MSAPGFKVMTEAGQALTAAGIESGADDALALMAHAFGAATPRYALMGELSRPLPDDVARRFAQAVAARLTRQPVAQIIGHRHFWKHRFTVTPDTLDPRPETEALVAAALGEPFLKVLDLGTGTGCILISLLLDMPMARGLGVDISPAALEVAAANAARLGAKADFRRSDWFSAVEGRFDLIVSNPPYIAAEEMAGLAPEVRDHEPHLALTPGGDGLEPYRIIARAAPARLLAGGRLIVEIGPAQGAAVTALFAAQGLAEVRIRPDLDGRDRVVLARKPAQTDDPCGV